MLELVTAEAVNLEAAEIVRVAALVFPRVLPKEHEPLHQEVARVLGCAEGKERGSALAKVARSASCRWPL